MCLLRPILYTLLLLLDGVGARVILEYTMLMHAAVENTPICCHSLLLCCVMHVSLDTPAAAVCTLENLR